METMTIDTDAPVATIEDGHSLREVCIFLCEYAAALLGSGATCIRLEHNVNRMSQRLGCIAVMTIMPRHIHLTVCDDAHHDSYTYISAINSHGISFAVNTGLSRLSWDLADGHIDFVEAQRLFGRIVARPATDKWLVLLLVSLANASFCRLFGGDFWAMGVVFMSTFAGYYLKQTLCAAKVDLRLVFIACALVSSVLGASAALFHLGTTPEVAEWTSVLYLVPGIPFLNSFSDLLASHYVSAFSRFMDALVLTACMTAGLCGGAFLMNVGMFE